MKPRPEVAGQRWRLKILGMVQLRSGGGGGHGLSAALGTGIKACKVRELLPYHAARAVG